MKVLMTALMLSLPLAMSGPAAAQALYEGPWCANVTLGTDSVVQRCDMRSFEMCLAEIRGNGGNCTPNPYYRGPIRDRSAGRPAAPTRQRY